MPKIQLNLPAWKNKQTGEEHESLEELCELVDVLLGNFTPNADDVKKYYGEDAPPSVYKALMFDRMILQREDGTYVVMPNTKPNERLWKVVD